jgi:hypothetical protein
MLYELFNKWLNTNSTSNIQPEININKNNEEIYKEEGNVVKFVVNKDNKLSISIDLQNLDDSSLDIFAYTLLNINNGYLTGQIIAELQELAISDTMKTLSISRILNSWTELFDAEKKLHYNDSNKPIISPLQFSKSVKTAEI